MDLSGVWKKRKPELICGLLCLTVLASLARILIKRSLTIETENATLQGYAIALSAQVEGEIHQVFVDENQPVTRGQLLCVLEDSRWVARLHDAEATRDALMAEWEDARVNERRTNFLYKRKEVAASVHDHIRSVLDSLFRQMQGAEARVAQARTNVYRTRILAPSDGIIAFRTARAGMLAEPGLPLFGFVDRKDRWVLARVRETDLRDLHIGKPVSVHFDSLPGQRFGGEIESISPATEKRFYSAIPADFSAGNYTKYVQWYPIRIRIALNKSEQAKLPIGISSTVRMTRD